MKRLAAFFTNKWVLGIIGLLALSLLVWFGAEYIKFGENNSTLSKGTRTVIILLIWGFWLTWNISRWVFERKQNDKLLKDIEQSQPEAEINPDEERSKDELAAISERFSDAMATLKKARFKSSKGDVSLYQLPWYIIIGPPGSGKSTALVNSGLEFPLAKNHGKESLGGVGGTRNCDWWFTNEAVLIDTAGRFTTQDSHKVIDNSAWNAFLNLLKRYRRRRPINGAIVAISLQDLMLQNAEQRAFQAKTIRTRINELQEQLGIRFPVYLTFTKCDLVAGFSEFFDNMSQAEREQVWGVSFPAEADARSGAPLDTFKSEYDELILRLNQRLLWRVHNERDIQKRSVLQGFPARMESIGEILDDFVRQTFSPNRYDIVPMVRGVYFTSATQEGSPIDRMMSAISANFGLERAAAKPQVARGKSYFLNLLLRDVVFPESELVGVNRKLESGMLWVRRGTFAGLAAIFGIAVALWFGSVARNKMYMGEVEDHINDFRAQRDELPADNRDFGKILSALEPLNEASQVYDREEHPWLRNIGLYDDRVDEAADKLYTSQLDALFLPTLKQSLEHQLNGLRGEDEQLFDTLKVYLMLFDLEHRENRSIQEFMRLQWEEEFEGEAGKQQVLAAHLQDLLEREEVPEGFSQNQDVVDSARRKLKSLNTAERLYKRLKNSELFYTEVNLYEEIGSDVDKVFDVQNRESLFAMPLMFTIDGYKSIDFSAESEFINSYSADNWIFGEDSIKGEDFSEKDRARVGEEVKRLYLSEYERRWRKFLNGFSVVAFKNTSNAIDILEKASDFSRSPILKIAEITATNTEITPKPKNVDLKKVKSPVSGKKGKAAKLAAGAALEKFNKYEPTNVDREFADLQRIAQSEKSRPAEIEEYLGATKEARNYLTDIDDAPSPNEEAYNAAKKRFGGGSDAIRELRTKAKSAPFPIKDWLNDIADNTWALVSSQAKGHVNTVWRQEVYAVCEQSIKNRYPMTANRNSEVSANEFNEFFAPNGIQDTFVKTYISPFVNTRTWKVKSFEGQQLALKQATLTQMRRAANIRKAFFNNGDAASMSFKIEPIKLDRSVRLFNLEIGDQFAKYTHGPPAPKDFLWTAGDDDRARIRFEDLNRTKHQTEENGDWAWLELLDVSKVETTSNKNVRRITFSKNGRSISYKVTTRTSISPFDRGLLRNYRCNESL